MYLYLSARTAGSANGHVHYFFYFQYSYQHMYYATTSIICCRDRRYMFVITRTNIVGKSGPAALMEPARLKKTNPPAR